MQQRSDFRDTLCLQILKINNNKTNTKKDTQIGKNLKIKSSHSKYICTTKFGFHQYFLGSSNEFQHPLNLKTYT